MDTSVDFKPTHTGVTDFVFTVDNTVIKYVDVILFNCNLLLLLCDRRANITVNSEADPSKCFLISALAPAYAIGASLVLSIQLAGYWQFLKDKL
jgi:hypothetical protein